MNIILIGGRGSGKTWISAELRKKIGWPVYDLDDLIVYENLQTIPEMVQAKGWPYFRDQEYEVCRKITKLDNIIISAGGGVIVDLDENGQEFYSERKIKLLKENSLVIYLEVPLDIQVKRITGDKNRPSLTGKTIEEELAEVMNRRAPWYEKAADHTIDAGTRTIAQNVEDVVQIAQNSSAAADKTQNEE